MADLLLSRVAEWWKRWVGEGERRGMLRNGGNCPHRAGAIQRTLSVEDNSACNRIVRDMKFDLPCKSNLTQASHEHAVSLFAP
jgi:hypothetical protein